MSYAGLINTGYIIGNASSSDVTNALQSASTVVNVSSATAPTSGQVLTASSGTAATWSTPSSSSEFTATAVKTASYTAVSGDWILCDANVAAGDIDITLPATPSTGDRVKITLATAHATRKVTINRNSSTIDGGTAAEFQTYNILWKAGDTVTFRCVGTSAWVTAERQIANRFMARMTLTTNQLNLTNTTVTEVLLDTVDVDYNGNLNTTTHLYTIPITGYYLCNAGVQWIGTSILANKLFVIWIDASSADNFIASNNHSALVANFDQEISTVKAFAAGDTITVNAYQACGVNTVDIAAGNGTYLDMTLMSRI
jgi:hypothetical protein